MSETFVDGSVFLGMHSRDERIRAACKAFFVERLGAPVVMSLEQVGRCDDIVWRRDRGIQDAYYPFMDNLHTEMAIDRRPYDVDDVRIGLDAPELAGLPVHERLLVGMALRRNGTVYTVSPRLAGRQELPVAEPPPAGGARFPDRLEQLYEESLVLRVTPEEW